MNKQDTKDLIAVINHLINKTSDLIIRYGKEPEADALSSSELSKFERPSSLKTAYSQGYILVEVAADQLMAFTRSLKEPIQTIAPFTCARSVLESCALANWLLDNRISAKDRVRRSLAFRFEGLEQQRKLMNSADSENGQEHFNNRINDIVETAKELEIEVYTNKKGKVNGIGVRMPTITKLTKKILDKEFEYRLFSSVTHAHHFALAQTSFAYHSDSEDQDISLFEKSLSPIFILHLCKTTSEVFIKAVESLTNLHGTYNEEYEKLFKSTLKKLESFSESIET